MTNLSHYYDQLFFQSKLYNGRRLILLFCTLTFLSISIYVNGFILYLLSIFALISQIISWLIKVKTNELNSLAHEMHSMHLISIAYGNIPSEFIISHLISKVDSNVFSKIDKKLKDEKVDGAKFTSDKNELGNNKLIKMIQENSYWNYNLYKYTYKRNCKIIIIALLIIITAFIIYLPFISFSQNFDFARLILSFLSFVILYEFLESTLIMKKGAESMLEIDNEISRNKVLDENKLLSIFSQYINIKNNVPSPPEKIYLKYRDILNNGWQEREK